MKRMPSAAAATVAVSSQRSRRHIPMTGVVVIIILSFTVVNDYYITVAAGADDDNDMRTTTVCPPGYWGEDCEDICPIQCLNAGQCKLVDDSHGNLESATDIVCDCPNDNYALPLCGTCKAGYWGDDCQDICPKICENGGYCELADDVHGNLQHSTDIVCICPKGFEGPLCNIDSSNTKKQSSSSLSTGGVIGIVIGGMVGIGLIVLMIVSLSPKRNVGSNSMEKEQQQQPTSSEGESTTTSNTLSPSSIEKEQQKQDGNVRNEGMESVTPATDLPRRDESFVETDADLV